MSTMSFIDVHRVIRKSFIFHKLCGPFHIKLGRIADAHQSHDMFNNSKQDPHIVKRNKTLK